jgi:hypothetical protein
MRGAAVSPFVKYVWWLVFYVFTRAMVHILYAHYGDRAGVLGILA